MNKKLTSIAAAIAFTLICSAPTFAASKGKRPHGTIVAITEQVADMKGADGKMYKIKVEDIVAENLKTGDIVEYDIIQGQPVHVHKKPVHKKKTAS